jgi:PIN domain nuclease of toxin-antitoxin system
VRVLLDTHVLLWSLSSPARLPQETREMIDAAEVYVSAASIWEISIKHGIGKLSADPREVLAAVEPSGFNLLAISAAHAAKVVELPPMHRDPFDRMLVAQAQHEPMILVTDDDLLSGYGPFVTVI